jgi:hypothetical protein
LFLGSNFDIYFSADYMTSVTEEGRVRPLSDLVVLNTSSWTWYSPNVPGPPPGGRFDHMSILYEDNTLIIGGGKDNSCVLYNNILILLIKAKPK